MSKRIETVDVDMSNIRNEADDTRDSLNKLEGSFENLNDSTKSYGKTANSVANAIENMGDASESVQRLTDGLGGLADTASGIAGGFAAVEGAMNLMGIESEDITKSILKMQSIMAITDGFDAIGRGVKGFYEMTRAVKTSTIAVKALRVAQKADAAITIALSRAIGTYTASTKAATIATKVLKTALITSGIGAIIVGISWAAGALIEKIDKLKDKSEQLRKESDKIKYSADNLKDMAKKDSDALNQVLGEIDKSYEKGEISLMESLKRKREIVDKHAEAIKKRMEFEGTSEGLQKRLQNDLNNTEKILESIDSKIQDVEDKAREAADAAAQHTEDVKKNLSEINDLIDDSTKTDLEKVKSDINKERKLRLDTLKESLDEKLITQEQYLGKVAAINKIFDKQIADEEIKVANEAAKTRAEAKAKIEEEYENKRAERLDKLSIDYELKLNNLYADYEVKIAEAESRGDVGESIDLRVEMLREERAILEELKQSYSELGDAAGTSDTESRLKSNEAETISTESEGDEWEVEKLTESFAITEEAVNEMLAMADGLNSAWGGVFANLTKGVEGVGKSLKKGEKGWKLYGNVAKASIGVAASFMSALADQQNADSKAGFEKQKKFQIAAATMSMLEGIVSAWAGAMQLGPILGPILGGINSALIATMGAMQISKIKSMQFEGSGGDVGAGTESIPVPSATALQSMQPTVSSTTNVEGASTEVDVSDHRVYVLESDIERVSKKVQVTESEAKY